MGTLDDDMSNLSFQRGFSLLNDDIMSLVEQVRPIYDKGEAIEEHNRKVEEIKEHLRQGAQSKERYLKPLEVLFNGLPKFNRGKSKQNPQGPVLRVSRSEIQRQPSTDDGHH